MKEIDRKELQAEINKLKGLSQQMLAAKGMYTDWTFITARAAAELLEPETILDILPTERSWWIAEYGLSELVLGKLTEQQLLNAAAGNILYPQTFDKAFEMICDSENYRIGPDFFYGDERRKKDIKLRIIRTFMQTDINALAVISANDKDMNVRNAAFRKYLNLKKKEISLISDTDTVIDIAKNDEDADVRHIAVSEVVRRAVREGPEKRSYEDTDLREELNDACERDPDLIKKLSDAQRECIMSFLGYKSLSGCGALVRALIRTYPDPIQLKAAADNGKQEEIKKAAAAELLRRSRHGFKGSDDDIRKAVISECADIGWLEGLSRDELEYVLIVLRDSSDTKNYIPPEVTRTLIALYKKGHERGIIKKWSSSIYIDEKCSHRDRPFPYPNSLLEHDDYYFKSGSESLGEML